MQFSSCRRAKRNWTAWGGKYRAWKNALELGSWMRMLGGLGLILEQTWNSVEMEDELQDIDLGVWVEHTTKKKRWTVVRWGKSMGKEMSSDLWGLRSGIFVNVAYVTVQFVCCVCFLNSQLITAPIYDVGRQFRAYVWCDNQIRIVGPAVTSDITSFLCFGSTRSHLC